MNDRRCWVPAAFSLLTILPLNPASAFATERPAVPPSRPRIDRCGDPLPEGLIARLERVRWRHDSIPRSLPNSAGGKTILTCAGGTLHFWDSRSGKEQRKVGGGDAPRDTVLPKLISGQVWVRGAQRIVEAWA